MFQRFGVRREVARSPRGVLLLSFDVADQRLRLVVDGLEVLARVFLDNCRVRW